MKQLLLLVVISSFAIGMVGFKGGDADDTAITTPSGTAGGGAAKAPAPADPNKAGLQASTATPTMSPNATDPRWKAGTMLKGGK